MSSTVSADKTADEYTEYVDSAEVRAAKITELAALVRAHAGHVVVYTGAGISTATGIPDFRSGLNSSTGMPAGKWCKDATSDEWTSKEAEQEMGRAAKTTSSLKAIPSHSHMALVELQRRGILKGLISQNCDGLHRRSGFPPEQLAELHGNCQLEYCGWCGKEYLRDFQASTGRHGPGRRLKQQLWARHSKLELKNPRKGNHYTGRRCAAMGCEGYLFDSTIDFGDNLPAIHIDRGYALAAQAGLCIVLGSRCSVSPACEMPISVGQRKGGRLAVVNLQRTAADADADLRIGAKIDEVMLPLMEALGLPVPAFTLTRRVRVVGVGGTPGAAVEVRGEEADGTPCDSIWNVQTVFGPDAGEGPSSQPMGMTLNQDTPATNKRGIAPGDQAVLKTFPWANDKARGRVAVTMRSGKTKGTSWTMAPDICDVDDSTFVVGSQRVCNAGRCHGPQLAHRVRPPPDASASALTLMFRAHYGEPPLALPYPAAGEEVVYQLAYSPMDGTWAEPKVLAREGETAPEPEETGAGAGAGGSALRAAAGV